MDLSIINEENGKHSLFIHLPGFVKQNYLKQLNEITNWKYGEYQNQEVDRVQQFFHIHGEPFCKSWKKITERWKSLEYYPWLLELQKNLEKELEQVLSPLYDSYGLTPLDFQSALINKYRDGNDFIPPHHDTTENENPTIVSLSFGETREFSVKRIVFGQEIEKIYQIKHGDVFIMGGLSQTNYTHEILPNSNITKERYNITFR
jgi:alkylated DNA repair dioxygenase AlkB